MISAVKINLFDRRLSSLDEIMLFENLECEINIIINTSGASLALIRDRE